MRQLANATIGGSRADGTTSRLRSPSHRNRETGQSSRNPYRGRVPEASGPARVSQPTLAGSLPFSHNCSLKIRNTAPIAGNRLLDHRRRQGIIPVRADLKKVAVHGALGIALAVCRSENRVECVDHLILCFLTNAPTTCWIHSRTRARVRSF